MKVAFLERDGTIHRNYNEEEWPEAVEPDYLPGSIEAIKSFVEKDYKIIILANQSPVDEGIIDIHHYYHFTGNLLKDLKKHNIDVLDMLHYSHHGDSDGTSSQEKNNLIEQAMVKYPEIDLDSSFFVVNSDCQNNFDEVVGLRFFIINQDAKVESLSNVVVHV